MVNSAFQIARKPYYKLQKEDLYLLTDTFQQIHLHFMQKKLKKIQHRKINFQMLYHSCT